MPGTTANGLPYPLPSEPVKDGAVAIQNLADALQVRGHGLRIEARRVTVTTDNNGYASIIYAKAFASPPVAVVWVERQGAGIDLWLSSFDGNNQIAMGTWFFIRRMFDNAAAPGSFSVQYIAIGPN